MGIILTIILCSGIIFMLSTNLILSNNYTGIFDRIVTYLLMVNSLASTILWTYGFFYVADVLETF